MKSGQTLISITIFLLSWEILARIPYLQSPLFPSVSEVALTFFNLKFDEAIILNYGLTAMRALIGFLAGLVAGLGIGILVSARSFQNYVQPVATIFFGVPSVAWIPLLIVWIGVKELELPIVASFLCSFPPVLYGTINALRAVDRDEVEVALVLGAKPSRVLWDIAIPEMFLKLIPIIKAEAVMSWKTVFVTEMVALSSGLGYLAMAYSTALEISKLIAVISVLALTTIGIIQLLDLVESGLANKWLGGDKAWLRLSYGP